MLLTGRPCHSIRPFPCQRRSSRCAVLPSNPPSPPSAVNCAARPHNAPLRRAQALAARGGEAGSEPPPPLAERLRGLGLAGLLSYGLLNTLYYSVAFSLLWLNVSQRGLGLQAAAQRSVAVFAACWAGSQLSKPLRLGGAVMLAPFARVLLVAVQSRLGRTEGEAFAILVSAALLFAGILYTILLALAA